MNRNYKIATETVRVVLLVFLVAFLLGYYHVGYKTVALSLGMRGFRYNSQQEAHNYLQSIGNSLPQDSTDPLRRVESYLIWIRQHVNLRPNPINHPNPAYLIERGGLCGQFMTVLQGLLQANDYEARQIMLNWNGSSTAHVIIEVRIGDHWIAVDPLGFGHDLSFKNITVSYILKQNGQPASVFDLYSNPSLLSPKYKFGSDFFRQGSAFKVEPASDYRSFQVTPSFTYGRDWPTISVANLEDGSWLYHYDQFASIHLRDVTWWSAFPYFSRLTFWFGMNPIVFHFEWPLILLTLGVYAVWRKRKTFSREKFQRCEYAFAALFALYSIAVTFLWWNRFQL